MLSDPVLNPFRCPFRMVACETHLPRYSNAIIFIVSPFNTENQEKNDTKNTTIRNDTIHVKMYEKCDKQDNMNIDQLYSCPLILET